jgi:sugar (pentulose or hexulose) kinase
MNDGYLVGVDCGTSSIRAGIFDLNGKMIAWSSQPLELKTPCVGWAEQDVSEWLAGLVKTVREAVAQMDTGTKRILGIGVTATSASVVAVDRDGRMPLCGWIFGVGPRRKKFKHRSRKGS